MTVTSPLAPALFSPTKWMSLAASKKSPLCSDWLMARASDDHGDWLVIERQIAAVLRQGLLEEELPVALLGGEGRQLDAPAGRRQRRPRG
jgi:hypothetical protein